MRIKICGLTEPINIDAITECDVDMIGLNFYPASSRYVAVDSLEIPDSIEKVGVFVNATYEDILNKTNHFGLNYVQLHGDEDIEFCRQIRAFVPVIKVFRIHQGFDWKLLDNFLFCDMFLFDTYTKDFGGSGHKFDWAELSNKDITKPWLLSGGIGPEDVEEILQISSPSFYGVDINSRFEISPGIKDVQKVKNFCNKLKN